MKLGLRNLRPLGDDWAAQFAAARRIGAGWLQVDGVADEAVATVRRLMEQTGVGLWSITALSLELLGPDMAASRAQQGKTRAAIDRAAELGAACVTMFAGHDPTRPFEANLATFREVFGPLAEHAGGKGVRIVLENCPMVGGQPAHPRNLAYCPAHWRAMFEAVESEALGLELDFGHLPGLGIDAVRAVEEFGPRIGHVGIKDAKVDGERVYERGWLGPGVAEHCLVGEGDVPFGVVLAALGRAGYDGPLTLDHIHPPTDTVERFEQAAANLRRCAAQTA